MSNIPAFVSILQANASDAVYHREAGTITCPCRTPEGYRDLTWHRDNPEAPICNEQGYLTISTTDAQVKAFVQPVQSGAVRRLTGEMIQSMFGEVESDDHLGIFPLVWGNVTLDFYNWSQAGEDFILYDGRRFIVVSANKIPDPSDGQPHHWEIGLRLVKTERPL